MANEKIASFSSDFSMMSDLRDLFFSRMENIDSTLSLTDVCIDSLFRVLTRTSLVM